MQHKGACKAILALTTAAALLGGCAAFAPQSRVHAPEAATGYQPKSGGYARRFMAATANPLATDAGYRILKAGGSAVDAAIAVQMVLNLVEPQSSGIGGGAFLLHFDGHQIQAFDGRETAPASATEDLFQGPQHNALGFYEGVVGGRSVGVPGVLRMLERAHRQHGKLPWKTLFAPAIELAENGFEVSPRLARLLQIDPYLKKDPVAAAYFYDQNGASWPAGHLLKNPELARTLRQVAEGGADAFYQGPIAHDIASKVRHHPVNPGGLTTQDMAAYRAKVREPVCIDYRQWQVCGMPPPSSGGIAVAQMLGMLERTGINKLTPTGLVPNALAVHLFSEAGRLAYADRAQYVADTDFVPLPGSSIAPLLDKTYLASRAALIGERSMGIAPSGTPFGPRLALGQDTSLALPSTSHISIVDASGDAVAMTSSIEDAFGSRQMVRGFLLNNQLTDFSFDAADDNGPIANRVEGGKRPRSAMAPTLVFDRSDHELAMVIGSPGGSGIINYVTKVLVAALDWRMNLQDAIALPNFGSRNGPTELERDRVSQALVAQLKARGHHVRIIEQTSGLQGIMRVKREGQAWWFGAADPRREGTVRGD